MKNYLQFLGKRYLFGRRCPSRQLIITDVIKREVLIHNRFFLMIALKREPCLHEDGSYHEVNLSKGLLSNPPPLYFQFHIETLRCGFPSSVKYGLCVFPPGFSPWTEYTLYNLAYWTPQTNIWMLLRKH